MKALALFLFALPALAIWSPRGQPVPVERALTNVRAQIKDRPSDPALWLVLGRLQSYAFFVASADVPMLNDRPFISNIPGQPRAKPPAAGDLAKLNESISAFRKVTELNPAEALAYLGLGWDFEQGHHSRDEALKAYRKAYELGAKKELAMTYLAPGYEAISKEAAERIVILQKDRNTPESRKEIAELQKSIDKLAHMPRAMTPVIFSFREGSPLHDLVAPEVRVPFDLDGLGRSRWSWLRASTGILVWDPLRTGKVESGLQLFGTATWWMFWRDGYAALAALDDNRDGWLSESELAGIAVWIDRNQNGRSDPGEVVSLADLGIVRLRATGVGGEGGILGAACGVQFTDGRCTPSYDWVSMAR